MTKLTFSQEGKMPSSRFVRAVSVVFVCAFALTAQAAATPGAATNPRSSRAFSPMAAKTAPSAPLSFQNRVINSSSVNNPAADATDQDTQSETSVAANGTNVVVGFNDSGSFLGGNNAFTGFANSTNSGASFTDRGAPSAAGLGNAGDPNLAIDSQSGNVFLSTLAFTNGSAIPVFKSTNNGASFGAAVNGIPGGSDLDKDWIAIDNFPGAGRGTLYLCATDFGFSPARIVVTHSTDGGVTWGPSGGVITSNTGQSQGCFLAVGPDHSLYVAYFRGNAPNAIFIRRSTDGGVSFGAEHQVAALSTTSVNGGLNLNGGFRTNSFPHMAVNPVSGAVVVVYNDDDVPSNGDNGNVFYTESTNSGATWSTPVKINDDSTRDQFTPTVAISPTGKQVAFGYYSRSHDPANLMFHRRIRTATMNTTTGAIAMRPSAQISPDTPVAIGQDPVVNATYMGDYDQIAATNQTFFSVWSDNRAGNSFHEFQPDVQIARVARNAPNTATDVGVTVTPHPASFDEGDTTRLAITVSAPGAAARDVYLSVGPDNGLAATSAAGCDVVNGAAGCSLGTITAGGSKSRSVFVTGTGGHRTAHVKVTTTDNDTNNANNSASAALTVNPPPGTTQSFSTGDIAVPIADSSTVNVPINVGPAGNVLDIDALVRLDHTFDADLDMFLISPGGGTTVELSTDNGSSGDNFGSGSNDCAGGSTRFNDAASTSITAGSAPFPGSYTPEGSLSGFNGLNESGQWTLQVTDDAGMDTGTIGCVRLVIRRP
jgi:subtilisin-like proprotein convertase family protein